MMGHRRPSVLKMATPMPSSTGASWANRHHQPLDGQVTRSIGQCLPSEEASVHAHSSSSSSTVQLTMLEMASPSSDRRSLLTALIRSDCPHK